MSNPVENYKGEKDSQIFNLSYLVLAVLILLTIAVTYNFFKSAKSKDLIRFNNHTSLLESSIENKINLYVALLKSVKGFIEINPELNRGNFADYAARLNINNEETGVQGIGFAKLVKAEEQNVFIKKMNAEGFADFKIFPDGEKTSYHTVVYLEPSDERNKKAIGFDVSAQTQHLEAIEQAKDTGGAAMSVKALLTQINEAENQEGFMIFLPVYQKEKPPAAAVRHDETLHGFVFIVFRAGNFFNQIYQTIPDRDISFRVYDNEPNPENLLAKTEFNNDRRLNFVNLTDEQYEAQNKLEIAGRTWFLEYNTLPGFEEQSSAGWTPLILLCGFAFSFMLFGMTYWEAASRFKMQKTAAELFEMQKQREVLLKNEREARQTAEQANATKDEFIAIISHELKTPLNAIAGWARILKTEELSRGTKELALQKIDKNLRSQADLVGQLLDYSEIISGKSVIKEEDVDFSEIFEESLAQIEPLAKEKSIAVNKHNGLDHHVIRGDKEKLKIVVQNLLVNAVKFTQNGGTLEAKVDESENEIRMIVRDDGRGISPEFLPYVFDRYKQADNPNVRDYGGLGLGLTISKHIVNLHRGRIEAVSDGKGKGATFIVTFPIKKRR